jgi:hypothetical protein
MTPQEQSKANGYKLNSAWEYNNAILTLKAMGTGMSMSDHDRKEYDKLHELVKQYEAEPTEPNIINAEKGNV